MPVAKRNRIIHKPQQGEMSVEKKEKVFLKPEGLVC